MSSQPGRGTRRTYSLDLDDIIVFPDIAHAPVLPPAEGESWYIITEIVKDISSLGRPVYRVQDKLPGNYWTVAFYTDNPEEDAKGCYPGALLCIKNGRPHQLDGQMGYRIDDASNALILPCTMRELRQFNNELRDRSAAGLLSACVACNARAKTGCLKCKTRYCSKECQRGDWGRHKHECAVLETLHEWNRTDWG